MEQDDNGVDQKPPLIPKPYQRYVDMGNTWTIYYSTGTRFSSKSMNIVNRHVGEQYLLMDVDRDGAAELLQVKNNRVYVYTNDKGVIGDVSPNSLSVPANSKIMGANVVDYNGMSHFICVQDGYVRCYSYSKDRGKNRLLTMLTDSYGLRYYNEYDDMTSPYGNYINGSITRYYPYAPLIAPLNLLRSSYIYKDSYTALKQYYYTWYGAVAHKTGLGFCGFEKVRTIEYVENITTEEERNPTLFGVTTKTDSPFSTAYYYYTRNEGSYRKCNPRMTSSNETDKLTGVYTYANYQYDAYNNPTKVTQNIDSGTLTQVTDQTYDNLVSSSRYLIGQPLVKTVTTTRRGASWTEKETITYDANRLPASRITYTGTGGSNKTGETRWTYDTNGNVTSEKSAPYNVTEFLGNTYTYDSSGRYLVSVTNALGQRKTYSNFGKYGNAHNIIDDKGRITYLDYDIWGQLISVDNPDGVSETITRSWGGVGLYTVTSTTTGSPDAVAHYDVLDREIRTGHQRFDGQWQYVDKVYDNKGRLEKVSLPFKGSSPSSWNTYTYDNYHRLVKLEEASGKTSTWVYNGLNITETRNGISSVKTIDATGTVMSVDDFGGTITYTYRPDGQPSSITAPGNVVTSFGYDAYGRQTSISDPSAGTQTFSEAYTSTGELTRTVTDANNKTVTSTYDKYGRITAVTRPEFNTAYTYNADELLISEISTNGTRIEYEEYDAYDRVKTVKETVPDGKWLQKEYTYSGGNVATVQYTAQSGLIGTENFVYAYGHNTEIKLGTTSIWKLTGENDLGQPTQATTGSMNRTYSYTAWGMPTGRTAGSIQSFTYEFDVDRGNLKNRKDNNRDITETFGYDPLNRLTNAAGKTITYSANGNITSIADVGTMEYTHSNRPYQVSLITPTGDAVPAREQSLTYTSFQRPATLEENDYAATFTYNAAGDRVRMHLKQGNTDVLKRYYISGQYEIDEQTNTERLYLGGDGYSAPAVYVKEAGSWKIYYICRDYLGSITHVANADGSLKAEYSYDAWGRLRNPATHVAYLPGTEPALFLARGYTGHEHLPWFGLINMNARLYDSALGRFLSPDPYVQMPDFTQNFNRYSYCLNNPLVYVDEDGEIILFVIGGALIGAYVGASIKGGSFNPAKWEGNWWQGALWGGAIGAVGGALVGSVWAAGGSISFGVQAFGLKPVTLVSFSKASAATGGVVTASIGGTTAATSIASYTLGHREETTQEKIEKIYGKSQTSQDPSLTIAGVGSTALSEMHYSKTYNTWMGKNYKIYQQSWGGNQYTGGKNKYGKKMSNYFRYLGYGIGAYSAADIHQKRINGDINWTEWSIEQSSNAFSTVGGQLGAAWSIGWEAGRAVTNTEWYQETKFNLFYDLWERKYGKPSSSNEWIWNYFYQNYKP